MFSLGNIQILHITDPDVAKEIIICTSLDLGKPSYQHKENGALLGQGILTSNGAIWAHQRKILAPQLYMDKVKVLSSIDESLNLELLQGVKILLSPVFFYFLTAQPFHLTSYININL